MTLGLAVAFLDINQNTVHGRKIEKLDFIKIKNYCSVKDTVEEMKKQACEKIFPKHTADEEPVSKIYAELLKSNSKKKNSYLLLVGLENDAATLKDKTKYTFTICPNHHSPWYF